VKMVKRTLRKTPRKQLRAAAPRAAGRYSEDEYVVEEPNVKLSRAFVVVLLLHVVAVGGIFAFSALKDHQQANSLPKSDGTKQVPNPNGSTIASKPSSKESIAPAGTYKVRTGDTLAGIAVQFGLTARDLEQANGLRSGAPLAPGRELIIPEKSAAKSMPSDVQKLLELKENKNASNQNSASPGTSELEKYYVIQRGDTPASIAKKLKVNSADLLKVNNIDDPRKLQIGQRLQIPSKIE
jgi:LysM repeat protein